MKILPQILQIFLFSGMLIISAVKSNQLYSQETNLAIKDSSLKEFTIDDLVKLKELLENERQRLLQNQERDLQRGVELSKDFLTKTRTENENQDMILIRVAEYYIEQDLDAYELSVENYNKRYEEYEKELNAYEAGQLKVEPVPPKFPTKNFEEGVAIYDLILSNFPESELTDDALYNKAYLLSEMEEDEASREVYLELIDKYPESEYAPEAYTHLAEYYFQPRLGQARDETIRNLNKAAQLYKNVLKYKESPRYDEALYKLGWTYYRLAAAEPNYYSDAILYFTLVVQDIEKFKEFDPEGKYIKSSIKPEALQYIAASFVDTSYTKNGVDKAKSFISNLQYPSYGVDILSNMGDLYGRIVEYDNSILAYHTLLETFPEYEHAPVIRKKIADVYLEAQQPEKAYQERQNLFEDYNPQTEWYAKIEQSDMPDRIARLDETTRLSEEALRSNLIYQLAKAQQAEQNGEDSLAAYNEFVKLSKLYLQTFPTHENAYEINWSLAFVLDTELKDYENAFEEYIRVSNDYLEVVHREDAATNAIAVAQTTVNLKKTTSDTAQISGMDLSQLTAQELTDEEKMLSEAFDNYIKLFPAEEKTASYLASAGALYYQHRQYNLARKYYKTMVTKFPQAQQKSVGLLSLMNSYFFLGKFKDSEFVAGKVANLEGIPEDQKQVAKKRIGESIYKAAEKLEQEEKYQQAAQEYYRVYTDAGFYEDIVDLALFNSGRSYEKIEEWQQAIHIFDTLVTNYEESEYRLVALGHIADDYKQMENFSGVGSTYERIHYLYPESEDAEAALYNSSLFYAKASAWRDAIRVNDVYINKYLESPESKELLFENARYYLKLNDLDNANRIYDEFAQRYPNDKRTIEAFFRRGEYYFDKGQFELAKQEFLKAINKSEEYARTGRDPNLYFASESYFKLGEIEFENFINIELTYPEATLRAQLQQKRNKLITVVDAFSKVITMGSIKGFEAMYKIAESYENMANSIAEQKINPNLPPEQQLVERDRVFKASVPAYDRAVDEYKNVIENVPIYAKKLEISLFDTSQTETQSPALEDTSGIIEKEMLQDSTREVALKWFHRAEDKISSLLYTVAERSQQFIHAYLRQENPATGLVYLSWKKLLLERAIAPAINLTLNAHLKNINISKQLELDNKYVWESERKILLTSDILADEYGKLVKKAVEIYEEQKLTLKELVEAGEQAATPDGLNSLDYNDQMMSIIDYMNEFLSIALNQYENTLKFARDNQINNEAVITTQDRLFNLAYESGSLMLDLSMDAVQLRDNYTSISDTTGDPKYQLGIVYFDDQQSILKNYALRGLEHSYRINKEYDIKNVWTNLILAKLVELDPAQYLGDLPREVFSVTSDASWVASKEYSMEWIEPDFDDSSWAQTSVVQLPFDLTFSGFDTLEMKPPSIWIVTVSTEKPILPSDTTVGDSLSGLTADTSEMISDTSIVPDTLLKPRSLELEDKEPVEERITQTLLPSDTMQLMGISEPDTVTVYFRKSFTLNDRTINGYALITGDDEYHLYLNGQYIKGDGYGAFETVDRISYIELSDFLNTGENIIAIDVTDFDGSPRYGLRFYMHLELLPVEITSAVERIRQRAAENVDADLLKKIVILNKNRIIQQ